MIETAGSKRLKSYLVSFKIYLYVFYFCRVRVHTKSNKRRLSANVIQNLPSLFNFMEFKSVQTVNSVSLKFDILFFS